MAPIIVPVGSIQIFELSLHLRITSAYEYSWCVCMVFGYYDIFFEFTLKSQNEYDHLDFLWCPKSEKDGNVNKQDATAVMRQIKTF